jgi:hypothetical protein
MIRPRVESRLVDQHWQAHLLKTWLTHNAASPWQPEAEALVARVDALLSEARASRPTEAATEPQTVAAFLDHANLPAGVKSAVADAMNMHIGNMTAAEHDVIETCLNVAGQCADYKNNAAGRQLFRTVLLWTVRFLASRLDLTKGDAPVIAYLFERKDGALPHEDDLQADYHGLMVSNVLGTQIEVSNVGGGRADVCFTYQPERLVTEVKRERQDSSFETLAKAYAAQTTDYQNVSVRLGFLLVLDQTELRVSGTPHISTLVRAQLIMRKDESEPRLIVTVKVPGRRLRPSDLTKAA